MESLKFLMVTTHYPPFQMGGDAVFVQYLSNELIKAGHQVEIFYNPSVYGIIRGHTTETEEHAPGSAPKRHVFKPRFPNISLLTALSIGYWGTARDRLLSVAKDFRPDIIHWHNTKGFIGVPFSVQGTVALYTAHDYYSVCPRSNLIKPRQRICDNPRMCQVCLAKWHKPPQLWRVGNRRPLRFPNDLRVLCPSEFMANRLRQDRISVYKVLRGFVPDPDRSAITPYLDRNLILFVGIMERRKGPHTLLEAFAKSRGKHGLRLMMIGDGPLKEELRRRAEALGIQDRVSIPGFLPRSGLESALRSARAMVVPSEWPENAPSTALEAFSFAIPVVGTNLGGLPEMLTKDSGSMLVQSGSANDLAEAIEWIWSHPDDCRAMGRMARATYETRFSPGVHVKEYLKIAIEPASHV